MSIYRDHAYSDVHAILKVNETAPSGEYGASGDPQVDQYKHLRKASPANIALPRTRTWASSLPEEIRPKALLRLYPRIANLIAAAWDDPKAFSSYMESLTSDTRGNRKGFPADVLHELGALALRRSQNDFRQPRGLRS